MNKKKNIKRKRRNTQNDTILMYPIIGLLLVVLSYVFLGWFLTAILVIGIIVILLVSKLINNLRKKKVSRNIINTIIILLLITCILGVIGVGGFCAYIVKKAPEFDATKLNKNNNTTIYDSENKLIAELGTEQRKNITYDQMSEVLIDALIATEDSRFFQHNGLDTARFIKASLGQAIGNSGAGGASTLSMQVIKNSFTSSESSGIDGIIRKFTDIYLSVFKLEKNYTKQEILEFYVNNHFLGNNAYGVEQASKTYFGKSASELTLPEAATIVGLFKAPTAYNPYINEDAATERRYTVLKLMYNHGYITKEEMNLANSIPIKSLLSTQEGKEQQYQSYIDTVVEEIDKKYNLNPYTTSMKIYTNMDTKKQKAFDNIFNGKSVKWKNSYYQAGVAAVDTHSGKIIAIGAGRNRTGVNSYNYATMINRQIGSTSKPIIDYAPGMEYLNWSTATIFKDEPWSYSSGQAVNNSTNTFRGKVTLRTALKYSLNIPALKAFQTLSKEIGLKEYQNFVKQFGIQTEEYFHEAHSIGSFNGSNPLTMAAAYVPFANGGYYYEPYSVNKIIYTDEVINEEVVIEHKSEPKQVISDSTAYMITSCLITAVESGYSSEGKMAGYTIAAKTGTTNYDEVTASKHHLPYDAVPDGWIIGYDPNVSLAVWFGCKDIDSKKYLKVNDSATEKGKVFREAAKAVMTKGSKFKKPSSVVKVQIETGTNPPKLASASTPANKKSYEYFKKGTEPTEISNKYSKQSNVSGLSVEYNPSTQTVSLDWNGVANVDEKPNESYGSFGYKIYKDDKLIDFTTDTTYTMYNVSNPYGTYKVVTSYENYSDNASSGAKYTLKDNSTSNTLSLSLINQNKTYNLNESLDSTDSDPSIEDIMVLYNSTDVTNSALISITITNSNGEIVKSINSDKIDTYVITYDVSYNSIKKTISRTIKIG